MTIGENIKFFRKQKGLTQKELGEKIGMSANSIQRYELEHRDPQNKTLDKIAEALGVSRADLYGIEKLGTSDTYVNDNGRVAHVFSKEAIDETNFGTKDIDAKLLLIAYIGRKAKGKNIRHIDDWNRIIDDVDKIIEANLEREKLLLGTKID